MNHGGLSEGWELTGQQRRDGVRVEHGYGQGWDVTAPQKPDITRCPCCKQELLTKKAARLVADAAYPLNGE